MKRELVIIPQLSIHPQQINLSYQYHWTPPKPRDGKNNSDYFAYVNDDGTLYEVRTKKFQHLLDSKRSAQGIVSKIAKRKINRATDYIMAVTTEKKVTNRITGRTVHMKLAFITLTLPSKQIHDDREIINKCLNQFLIEIKKNHQVRNYIWRAEKQKNNNIHFHILIDRFINFQELRDRWNRICEKLGYVTRYRENQLNWHKDGFKVHQNLLKTWSYEKQRRAYERGNSRHWSSPNTTDIHALKKIQNVKAYISKYITKQPGQNNNSNTESLEQSSQTGRIWGCNRDLNNLKGARIDIDNRIDSEINKLDADNSVKKYSDTYFTIYYVDFKTLTARGCNQLFNELSLYLFNHFGTPLQPEFLNQ